ncbi:uncharacterized protein C8orf74 homolog isoform X4 [Lissotriton helveticus]
MLFTKVSPLQRRKDFHGLQWQWLVDYPKSCVMKLKILTTTKMFPAQTDQKFLKTQQLVSAQWWKALCEGISVSEVIFCLKDKFQGSESELTANHRLILLNYFITLFIRHYHLYQFVLSQDQDVDQTFIKLEIQPPPQPPALMEGIDKDMWLYQQEIARLTSSEAEKRSNILFLRQIRQLEAEETLQKLYEDLKTQDIPSLDKQLLEKVVKDAIRGQVEIAKDSLQEEVKMTYEILELQLRKKSLKPPLEYPPSVSSTKASKAETVKKQRKSKSPKKNFWKKL